ncbi:MAG: hypothetical protein QF440_02605 [Candidatus Thalassarchaeaceae archaeon]|jgi:hypothetical protein|nr:hypothetical protein [Candidatus Thalassarchaeaceae archaeon]
MNLPNIDLKTVLRSKKVRRSGLTLAFYLVLALLLYSIVSSYLVDGEPHLSAYDDDWDDLSTFRNDLIDMGVETGSLVSSAVLLEEIDNPEDTVFVITGVEQDTISLPRFTGDTDVVQWQESEGYTTTEIESIFSFVAKGGTIIVMDDFGWSGALAEAFGLQYSGHRLYDAESWARELDHNYIWMNVTDPYTYTTMDMSSQHPCFSDSDGDGIIDRLDNLPNNPTNPQQITESDAGLCAHHLEQNGDWNFSTNYNVLLNSPSAFDKDAAELQTQRRYAIGTSSQDSYLDSNNDGNLTVGFEGGGVESDEQGPFTMAVKVCQNVDCEENGGMPMGRAIFVTDGSALINVIYDHDDANEGDYGSLDGKEIPLNDNRKWMLDMIAESLLSHDNSTDSNGEPTGASGSGKQVIFDESRHQQPSAMGDTYNLIYYILVYFTNDWMAMLFLFLALFITFEAIIIKKIDPEPWRHVFSIIYYGFGDARRYGYYGRANKVKQVLLSRVRNLNSLTRDEFDALPARELQRMIGDPVLVKFVFEDRNYSLEQLVAVVKRVKMWGRK